MRSKLLEYLGITEAEEARFPKDISELVKFIDGAQKLFSESKDSPKKQKLADIIVSTNRNLMEYFQKNNFGVYANNNISQEKNNLPDESILEKEAKQKIAVEKKIKNIKVTPEPEPQPNEPIEEPKSEPNPQTQPEPKEKSFEEKRQALDEFFTPYWVAEIMYMLAVKHGFTYGNVCEPSFGHGVFFDVLLENGISEENLYGFEIYKPNFDFVKAKFPKANLVDHNFEYEFAKANNAFKRDGIILSEKFQHAEIDLFIGNPPYGSHTSPYSYLFDKDAQIRYEGFFILLALSKLKKDGLCVFIINSLWLNNGNKYNKQKEMIAKYGDMIDAYRLPNGIFKGENRDTNIATDIVVFKRK